MNTFYKVTFRKIEKPLPVLHKLWLYIFIIVNTQSVIGSTQQLQDQVNNKKQQLHFTISGTIKDKATGETMIGATIVIKDHNTGVVTNEYGFFSITLPKNDYILQVSYVGFVPKEIKVHLDGHKKYEIELTMSSNALDEVLITSENNSKSQVKNVLLGTSSLKSKDIKMFPP